MSRHFLDTQIRRSRSKKSGLQVPGWSQQPSYESWDEWEDFPEDMTPVISAEDWDKVMPTGTLDPDDDLTLYYTQGIEELSVILRDAQHEDRGLCLEEFAYLEDKGWLAVDGELSNERFLDQLYSLEALDEKQSHVVTDKTVDVLKNMVSTLVGSSISNLDDKWFEIDKNLEHRVNEISKLTTLKPDFKTHYLEKGARKVSDGVKDGAVLISELMRRLDWKELLEKGTDKPLEEINAHLQKFVKAYADVFYIDDMSIEKSGSVTFVHHHRDKNVNISLYADNGEDPSKAGWTSDSLKVFQTDLKKALSILQTTLNSLRGLARDEKALPNAIMEEKGTEDISKNAEVTMFVQAVLSCVSYILGRVVDWGGNWCKECAFRLYH